MKDEKVQSEQILEFLNLNFTVTNHCLSIREERGGADLCYDIVSVELKNVRVKLTIIYYNKIRYFNNKGFIQEQDTLEKLKQLLTGLCQIAWEQINKLEELRVNVSEDLYNKNNTICMDTELLKMTKDSTNISLKPDPLRVPLE